MRVGPRRLRVFVSPTVTNPFLNIAAEDHLFGQAHLAEEREEMLFLWRNERCVIIGRNQNPWKECRIEEMDRRGVLLVRRHSGGGAVYQDLGNSNFSFVSPRKLFSKEFNSGLLLGALRRFGIGAELKGRNDIVLGETKISGHAYKLNNHSALHHGTLLRDVSMETLQAVLSPSKAKLQSKGVASVQARVTNLAARFPGLSHETFCEAMIQEFRQAYPEAEMVTEELKESDLRAIPQVASQEERLSSWDWRFGESPNFSLNITQRFDWGICDLYLDWEKGKVQRSKLFSDALSPELVAALQLGVDAQLDANAAANVLPPEMRGQVDEFFNWIHRELRN